MDTKQKKRPAAAPARRKAPSKAAPQRRRNSSAEAAPQRRRKTAAAAPTREERQRRSAMRRTTKKQNPPARRRVVRPPQEEIPEVIYTAPRPLTRSRFILSLASVAAVAAAVFLALSVFFRVETIAVAGAEKYTPWMIRQAAGVEPGDALLSIGEARVASRIRMKLPYVDEIKVGVRLPGTVEIQITELQVTYSIEDESGAWWLISADGRAVEQVSLDKALGYTRVEGLAIRTPQPGQQVQALPGQIIDPDEGTAVEQDQSDADQQLAALISVMTALEQNRIIGQIALIDLTDINGIRLEYPQLLTVRLGDDTQLAHKIEFLAAAVEELADRQSGELDLSLEYADAAVFTPIR